MDYGPIIPDEVKFVVKKLKSKKVGGVDDILPEHFKALVTTEGGLKLVLELCQLCWEIRNTPKTWKISQVALLFKAGDPSNCANYRPISLLCIGYKIVAAILLERLKNGGAEKKVWKHSLVLKVNLVRSTLYFYFDVCWIIYGLKKCKRSFCGIGLGQSI